MAALATRSVLLCRMQTNGSAHGVLQAATQLVLT
jgi:hypothetical protein